MKLSTRPSLLTSAITALVVIIPGCAPHSPHSAETAPQTSPLGPFASLPPSQWKMGTTSNVGMYDTWMWGPGYHSIRVMTHNDSDPDTTPWRAVQAIYRNPATNKLHAWSINPYAHSVDEGVITVTPNSAECTSDLYQTNIHRFLTRRWTFESAEIHHLALLEASTPDKLTPLVDWQYTRLPSITPAPPIPPDQLPQFPEQLRSLQPLVVHTWESTTPTRLRVTVEWIPFSDGLYARVLDPMDAEHPVHTLDIYLYHHTQAKTLRCLALSATGAVYEGDVTPVSAGVIQADLRCSETSTVTRLDVQLRIENHAEFTVKAHRVPAGQRPPQMDWSFRAIDAP